MTNRLRRWTRLAIVAFALFSSLAVVAAFCLPGSVAFAADASANCGNGAVVVVAGTNDPEGADMVKAVDGYKAKGYEVISVDYPTTLWPLGATGYDADVAQGVAATKSAIGGYQSSCSGSPVVVVGYSQGARVAGDVLSDIGNNRDDAVTLADGESYDISSTGITGLLYSDPRRDGSVDGEGVELALIGIIPGLTMSGPRQGGFGDIAVTEVCAQGDGVCDVPDPLHDPIGALDALVGYFVYHGVYPSLMDETVSSYSTCSTSGGTTTCMISEPSAIVSLLRNAADSIGLDGSAIPDFLANRPTLDLPAGIALSNLQPIVKVVQGLFPQLPQLGYGAYLPDLFVFQNIVNGIVNNAPAQFTAGVTALAASVKSIVLLPVNFTKYWVDQIVTTVQGATTTSTTSTPAVTTLAARSSDASVDTVSSDTDLSTSDLRSARRAVHSLILRASAVEPQDVTTTGDDSTSNSGDDRRQDGGHPVATPPAGDSYDAAATSAPADAPAAPPVNPSPAPAPAPSGNDGGGTPAIGDSKQLIGVRPDAITSDNPSEAPGDGAGDGGPSGPDGAGSGSGVTTHGGSSHGGSVQGGSSQGDSGQAGSGSAGNDGGSALGGGTSGSGTSSSGTSSSGTSGGTSTGG